MKIHESLLLMTATLLPHVSNASINPDFIYLGSDSATVVNGDKNRKPLPNPMTDGDGYPLPPALAPLSPAEGGLEWKLEVPARGRYHVILEASQGRSGNPFEIRVDDQVLKGFMPGTRETPALIEVGVFDLDAGSQTLRVSSLTASEPVYMSVHSVLLRPESAGSMSLPAIRVGIAKFKPEIPPKELSMPIVFSDHTVLQRRMRFPVWGRAVPGAAVKVSFNRQTPETKADATGRWRVDLDPMEAGGPHRLEISDGTKTIALEDVLIGEVWFGSGQSNMEVSYNLREENKMKVECDEDTRQLMENGANNSIRISALTHDHSQNVTWTILTKENCLDAPALMSSAAVLLNQKMGVPIGVVIRCKSSSPSCIWLSRDAVEGDAAIQAQLAEYTKNTYPRLLSEYPATLKAWEEASEKAKAEGKRPSAAPRKPFPAGRFTGDFDPEVDRREYPGANYQRRIASVPPFAVRGIVWDQGESGTGMAGVDQTALMPALVHEWRTAWGRLELPFIYTDKKMLPAGYKKAMAALPETAFVPYEGLNTANHPPDKAAYARRLVEQMEKLVYGNDPEAAKK